MRILIHGIDFTPEKVGTGKYTGEMAEWLAERGHDVIAVTTAPHFPEWRVFQGYSSWRYSREVWLSRKHGEGSLTIIRCPVWIPRNPRGWSRILYLASFALSSLPPMLLHSWRSPDLVLMIEPTFFCAPHVLSVARVAGAAAWLHIQDFEVDAAFQLGGVSGVLKRLMLSIERMFTSKFDRVSTISPRMVERLSEKGVLAENSVLFPNWVDTRQIYPLQQPSTFRQELGIPEQAIVALYSGSMGAKQNLELLAEASRRLAHRRDIYFVIGGAGPEQQKLMQGKPSNMILIPLQPLERINELLNLADIHLLPRASEASDLGMPSKLTGMMASGRAIIASALPGTQIAKVLKGRGIVTPPDNADALASTIVQIASNPELRRTLGRAAREYAVQHLDRDEILRSFEMSILELCGQSITSGEENVHVDVAVPSNFQT